MQRKHSYSMCLHFSERLGKPCYYCVSELFPERTNKSFSIFVVFSHLACPQTSFSFWIYLQVTGRSPNGTQTLISFVLRFCWKTGEALLLLCVRIFSRRNEWKFYNIHTCMSSSLPPTKFEFLNLFPSHLTRSQCNADNHIRCVNILQKDCASLAIIGRQKFFPNAQMAVLQ